MQSIPDYLIILTGVVVVIPTFLAIILRISLYQEISKESAKIRNLIKQPDSIRPDFIDLLVTRFTNASSKLEQVNTGALIDQLYSTAKIGVFSREWVDHFCRVLPNLLLAFGLMGTFLGITINLVSLSETITKAGASDVNSLVKALQTPLEGMGIAFTTSLAGLICSALLTVANLIWNTTLAKYELISLLEDYLDNIYHPTLQGQTRLDVVVKNMADTFERFLTRFGQTVREGIESALAEKIEQLMEANLKAATLAEQVYSRLADASGTIATGADRFHQSADNFAQAAQTFARTDFPQQLSQAADNFAQAAQTFAGSDFPQQLSQAVADLVSIQNSFTENTNNLVGAETSFSDSISQLNEVTTALGNSLQQIDLLNQQIVDFLSGMNNSQSEFLKMLRLSKSGQQQLSESIPVLNEAINEIGNLNNEIGSLKEVSKEIQDALKELRELSRKLAHDIVWREPIHESLQGFPNKNEPIKPPQPSAQTVELTSEPNWVPYKPSNQTDPLQDIPVSDITEDAWGQVDADRTDWSLIEALKKVDSKFNPKPNPNANESPNT